MVNLFITKSIFSFILGGVVFILLQKFPCTRIYRQPRYLIEYGFIKGRINRCLRILATVLATLGPIYSVVLIDDLGLASILLPFMVLPISVAFLLPVEFQRAENSQLIFSKPLWSSVATVHLKSHYQSFSRDTYVELIKLVKLLPSKGVSTIKLTSPMFYHPNGELRSLRTLEKQLARNKATLSHAPVRFFDCIIGKIIMNVSKPNVKNTINIRHWHVITIDLESPI